MNRVNYWYYKKYKKNKRNSIKRNSEIRLIFFLQKTTSFIFYDNIKIILNNHHNIILNLLENRYKILEKYHFTSLFKILRFGYPYKTFALLNIFFK